MLSVGWFRVAGMSLKKEVIHSIGLEFVAVVAAAILFRALNVQALINQFFPAKEL